MAKDKYLGVGKERTFTLPQEANVNYVTVALENPRGARVKCEVLSGVGEFSLYKNGRWVGNTYTLSAEPGYPKTVHLRTLTAKEEYATENKTLTKGKLPKNKWELYVVALNNDKSQDQAQFKFRVKLTQ
jgi:hypothetical protein